MATVVILNAAEGRAQSTPQPVQGITTIKVKGMSSSASVVNISADGYLVDQIKSNGVYTIPFGTVSLIAQLDKTETGEQITVEVSDQT